MAVFASFQRSFGAFPMSRLIISLREKTALQAAVDCHRKAFPGANPRRGQERKEALGARLGSRAAGSFCRLPGGLTREARASAGGWGEFAN